MNDWFATLAPLIPGVAVWFFAAKFALRIQTVVSARFEHVIRMHQRDIARLEEELAEEQRKREADRLRFYRELRAERETRRAENDRCHEDLQQVRAELARVRNGGQQGGQPR